MSTTTRLALDGGTPVRREPLLPGWPGGLLIGDEEKAQVLEVLESQSLYRHYGPRPRHKAAELEQAFAQAMGARHALAVTSGTGALIVGLAALGIGPGDEVIVPTYTWVATVNAVVTLGAVPVFVDIDESLTMDPTAVEAAVTPLTVAIVPVHMRGAGADMARIMAVADRHRLAVLEDSAQAVGGRFRGRRLGTFGRLGAFSLQYHKVITTGEGGMLVSDDTALFERAVRYHDQGSVRVEELDELIPEGSPLIIGVNYRMSELTAAVGVAQLTRMDWIIGRMRQHKSRLLGAVADLPALRVRPLPDSEGDTGATFIVYAPTADQATRFARALTAEGVPASVAWTSGQHVYHHFDQLIERRFLSARHCAWECPHYRGKATLGKGQFPRSDDLLKRAVHLDLHPLFSDRDVADIAEAMAKVAAALL
ncbi:MAG TPA: DegT/DnrJ/EryC1/StrS family aminotransferase [Methylomirabilota bacterium]|nr:DegT/DnrJ/EryC1/StrS family aminotransferase [Methylomirabilota bacterium]